MFKFIEGKFLDLAQGSDLPWQVKWVFFLVVPEEGTTVRSQPGSVGRTATWLTGLLCPLFPLLPSVWFNLTLTDHLVCLTRVQVHSICWFTCLKLILTADFFLHPEWGQPLMKTALHVWSLGLHCQGCCLVISLPQGCSDPRILIELELETLLTRATGERPMGNSNACDFQVGVSSPQEASQWGPREGRG